MLLSTTTALRSKKNDRRNDPSLAQTQHKNTTAATQRKEKLMRLSVAPDRLAVSCSARKRAVPGDAAGPLPAPCGPEAPRT